MKTRIKNHLEEFEKAQIKNSLHEKVLKTLIESNPIELPPSLVKDQKESLKKNSTQTLTQKGWSESKIHDYYNKWDDDFTKNASDIIHTSLLIEAIVKKENLQVSPEELDHEINQIVNSSTNNQEKIRKFYSHPDNRSSILYRLIEKKVVDFVTTHSHFY